MKKLFTFLMAMVITTMVFGQKMVTLHPVNQPIQDNQDRTGWIGGIDGEQPYFWDFNEGEKIAMRLPAAGELPAGNCYVTKVAFGWQPTDSEDQQMGTEFRVLIYAGGDGSWVDPATASMNPLYNPDVTVQGELLYSQDYTCTQGNYQIIELTERVALPANQEIWITLEALSNSCIWAIPDLQFEHQDWWGQYLVYSEFEGEYAWAAPAYTLTGSLPCWTVKYDLKALIDNGEAYVNTTDWLVEMYIPEEAANQENITYLYVDEFMLEDSLYLAPAFWNLGPDSNNADGRVFMYIETEDHGIIDTLIDENLSVIVALSPKGIYVASMEGYTLTGLDGLMAFSDMEEMGLTFPFNVCVSYESFGLDPNTANNIACVEISDVEPDGISENSNTLSISPNPASTYIKVENAAGSQITVYNLSGQEVLSVASAEANETLNVSNLNAGLYIVRVVNGNEVSTAKVSIVR